MASVEKMYVRFSTVLYSRASQLCIDGAIVAAALWVAYMIRFDGSLPEVYQKQFLTVLPFAVFLYSGVNVLLGIYNRVWRFTGLRDAAAIASSVACVALVGSLWRLTYSGVLTHGPVPFGVLLIHPFLTYSAMIGIRLTRRILYHRAGAIRQEGEAVCVRKQVLLVGAGEAGLHLLHQLRDTDYEIVGFLDDDLQLQARNIGGWRVLGTTQDLEAVV